MFSLIWILIGLLGAYSSIIWYRFFKKVRYLTGTRWAWGFLFASPLFTLFVFCIGFGSLLTSTELGTFYFLLSYLTLWFVCLIPVAIWDTAIGKIPKWGDLRYTLKATDAVIFSFLNWGMAGGKGDNPGTKLLYLIFFPFFPPFIALFAQLKAAVSPPPSLYSAGSRAKGGVGLYSAKDVKKGRRRRDER